MKRNELFSPSKMNGAIGHSIFNKFSALDTTMISRENRHIHWAGQEVRQTSAPRDHKEVHHEMEPTNTRAIRPGWWKQSMSGSTKCCCDEQDPDLLEVKHMSLW